MNNKIGFVIPSYHDSLGNWMNIFVKKAIPSYKFLSEIDNIEFLINLQNYPTEDRLLVKKELLNLLNLNETWSIKLAVNEKYNPVSMVKIRNDCMKLSPDCYLYVFLDDDVVHKSESGKCYSEIINFFNEDKDLGVVMSAGFLGGYNYVGKLRYDDTKWYWTNKGLFIRNDERGIYSDYCINNLEGGYEEILVAIEHLSKGYKLATHFNNNASHKSDQWKERELNVDKSKLKSNVLETEIDYIHKEPCTNMKNYFKDKFGIDFDVNETKDFKKLMSIISRRNNG